jgi:hypothetical protein
MEYGLLLIAIFQSLAGLNASTSSFDCAMYLALRFHITKEIEETNFPLTNWMENHRWFDFKLLVDAFNPTRDWKMAIKSNPYSIAIKTVLRELRLTIESLCSFGTKNRPKRARDASSRGIANGSVGQLVDKCERSTLLSQTSRRSN